MKEFIKKVIYFDIVYNLTDIFFSNTFFFEKGKIFHVIVDTWTLIFFIGWFFCGILAIGIMKFLSLRIDKFIYESNSLICYSAFILRGLTWFNVGFYNLSNQYYWQILEGAIYVLCFVLVVILLFCLWKYRIEISTGIFLTAFIYAFTHWEIAFYSIFNIEKPNDFLQGLFILGVLILFLPIIIFFRKKGFYDFRSRKDKWLEAKGEGPYKKCHK